jgi:rod shape-determining protein MreD
VGALGLALLIAVLVQVGLLAVLPLPGATPDLVLVLVAALAIARGPGVGAAAGFTGGLLLDLIPPATHAAGQWALVLTLVGYVAGHLGDPRLRPGARLVLVGGLAGLATITYVTASSLLGARWLPIRELAVLAGTGTAYAAALAVVVLPGGWWLAGRLTVPSRTAW